MSEMKGKIIKGIAGFYYVDDGAGTVVQCRAKGVFRSRKVKPLVGDNVEFDLTDEKDLEGNVTEILPRKNALIRPAAANVDQALVVFALSHPAPNLNLLDRFLVMMEAQQVPVIICFNKADLADEKEEEKYRLIYEPAGYQVMFTSVREKTGVEAVREKLTGKTTVFAGPSGVGKSSLTNELFPEAAMETGSISRKIQRGRHTTRHTETAHWSGRIFPRRAKANICPVSFPSPLQLQVLSRTLVNITWYPAAHRSGGTFLPLFRLRGLVEADDHRYLLGPP